MNSSGTAARLIGEANIKKLAVDQLSRNADRKRFFELLETPNTALRVGGENEQAHLSWHIDRGGGDYFSLSYGPNDTEVFVGGDPEKLKVRKVGNEFRVYLNPDDMHDGPVTEDDYYSIEFFSLTPVS